MSEAEKILREAGFTRFLRNGIHVAWVSPSGERFFMSDEELAATLTR